MPLIAFSIKLDRIDETLLYQDPAGGWWLGGVCTLDTDQKGRMIVAQSISKERYAAGERGRPLGTWREIGASKPSPSAKPAFDLFKYKKPSAPDQLPSTALSATHHAETLRKGDL